MSSASPTSRRKLRNEFRRQRRALSETQQQQHAEAVRRHLNNAGLLWRTGAVGAYLADPAEGELNCLPTISLLWQRGRRVGLPVVGGQRGFMDLFRYQPDTRLIRNRYDILEPEPGSSHVPLLSCSLLLMPLVAFDDHGTRLGMGGGYYDRFLARLPAGLRPRLIGVGHELQRASSELPRDRWDIPLDDVVTELGWQQFSQPANATY